MCLNNKKVGLLRLGAERREKGDLSVEGRHDVCELLGVSSQVFADVEEDGCASVYH